jgi:hypothetical protein
VSAAPSLVRGLAARDGALITIGAMLGSGILLTTDDTARRLPQGGLILLLWGAGRLVTLAGALAYTKPGEDVSARRWAIPLPLLLRGIRWRAVSRRQRGRGVRASADAPERS